MRRHLKHLKHLYRVSKVLASHDALFFLEAMPVKPFVIELARSTARVKDTSGRKGERLARALQELGPTFIKLGQALSTRADLVGEEIAKDLSMLQDDLPSFPFEEAKAIIEEELDQPLEAMFAQFEEEPVAAASISQVHFAETIAGEKVAVKVMRPGIERVFYQQIDLLFGIAEILDRFIPKLKRLKLIEVVEDFEHTVKIEMDLRFEAAAASELSDNFAGDPILKIPEVFWDFTSQRVLTTERISGISIDDVEAIKAAGHDVNAVMEKASHIFFKQVYRDGFFHADMHPGNLFVGAGGEIIAVDFGIMGRLDEQTRIFLAEMLFGFLNRDYYAISDVHFRAGYIPPHQDKALFAQAVRSIGEPIFGKSSGEISIARVLAQLFKITDDFEMETQPQLILLQKTMMLAEGIGRNLNPNVNFWELARPLMEDWAKTHLGVPHDIRQAARESFKAPRRLYYIGQMIDNLPSVISSEGLRLHPSTIRRAVEYQRGRERKSVVYWKVAMVAIASSALTFWLLSLL